MEDRPAATLTFLLLAPAVEAGSGAPPTGPVHAEALLREALAGSLGTLFHTGFPLAVAFPVAAAAVRTALTVQRALLAADPGGGAALVLHTGAAEAAGGDYRGPTLSHAAWLLAVAHPGQVLLSAASAALVAGALPAGAALTDLGTGRLADLQRTEHIFQLQAPGLPAAFPPLRTLEARPTNLPPQPTLLIGRGPELGAVADLLRQGEVRLVTLTGPGGTGKTRLALQVAADLLGAFPDGVWLVELDTVAEAAGVPAAIAGVLGVHEAGTAPILTTVQAYLRERRLLLVLDNFEQVVSAAPLVSDLLRAAPALKVLVTSRVPLRLAGEHQYPVPPLARPDPRHLPPLAELAAYEAVRLFEARARDVCPDFAVTAANAPAVAAICARLDGLPLALELAAARVKILPPAALLARLEHRLQVLTGGARNQAARQQTLRGAIAWSYDLLDEGERLLFRRLAVFAGGCALEAIEAVANGAGDLPLDVLDGVSLLVDQNLLRQEEGAGGEPRFVLLETIHEYARERLAASQEEAVCQARHAAYFVAWAERAEPELAGPAQPAWLARLEEELDNVRAALAWALERPERVEAALRLGSALLRFWHARGYLSEGRRWLEAALAQDGAVALGLRAKARKAAATLLLDQGDYTAARAGLEDALGLYRQAGDSEGVAAALNNLGIVANRQGDYAAARAWLEEGLGVRRERADPTDLVRSMLNLGDLELQHGYYTEAQVRLDECLPLCRALGDKQLIAYVLGDLALLATVRGELPLAEARARESIALFREVGDKLNLIEALLDLAAIQYARGEYSAARRLLEECLTSANEQANRPVIARALEGFAELAAATGQPERAVQWCAAAAALRQELGDPLLAHEAVRTVRVLEVARAALGVAAYDQAVAAGTTLPLAQAIEDALHPDSTGGTPAFAVEIDSRKKAQQLQEITETDFFRGLQQRAVELRSPPTRGKAR